MAKARESLNVLIQIHIDRIYHRGESMKISSIAESQTWYRGSNANDPLQMRDDGNASDQLGPGIYFTDDHRIAAGYGKVKRYSIDTSKGFYTKGQRIDLKKLKELISYADREHLEVSLSNWDENPKIAMTKLLNSIKNSKDMPDAITQIVVDVFRSDREDFMMACRASDINGIIIDDPYDSGRSSHFLILYNPRLARVEDHDPDISDIE